MWQILSSIEFFTCEFLKVKCLYSTVAIIDMSVNMLVLILRPKGHFTHKTEGP